MHSNSSQIKIPMVGEVRRAGPKLYKIVDVLDHGVTVVDVPMNWSDSNPVARLSWNSGDYIQTHTYEGRLYPWWKVIMTGRRYGP